MVARIAPTFLDTSPRQETDLILADLPAHGLQMRYALFLLSPNNAATVRYPEDELFSIMTFIGATSCFRVSGAALTLR